MRVEELDKETEELRLHTLKAKAEISKLAELSPLRGCAPAKIRISPSRGGKVQQRRSLPVTK